MTSCPHPTKVRHATLLEAGQRAFRVRVRSPAPWRTWFIGPYHCRCGWYHIGRRISRGRWMKDVARRAQNGLTIKQYELHSLGGAEPMRQILTGTECHWCLQPKAECRC